MYSLWKHAENNVNFIRIRIPGIDEASDKFSIIGNYKDSLEIISPLLQDAIFLFFMTIAALIVTKLNFQGKIGTLASQLSRPGKLLPFVLMFNAP